MVTITNQDDFLTKTTFRYHRSRPWREGNLPHPGPNGAYGESEGCAHPGKGARTLVNAHPKNSSRPAWAHGIADQANTPPCAPSGRGKWFTRKFQGDAFHKASPFAITFNALGVGGMDYGVITNQDDFLTKTNLRYHRPRPWREGSMDNGYHHKPG